MPGPLQLCHGIGRALSAWAKKSATPLRLSGPPSASMSLAVPQVGPGRP